ncbi:hypothetical protein U9M48_043127 [Paspalum notatum var. saurae]|uniref:Reverse transcriptase Ty1/copia-type domain-containing protein n=1 Tax=Paspalum notatum var. saurae TaxID=547442 RepID=A0AAQ3UWT7_PASNO
MDPPAGGSPDRRGNGPGVGAAPSGLRRYGLNFSASSLLQAPLAALLEYSGVVPSGPAPQAAHHPSSAPSSASSASEVDGLLSAAAAGDGEVSIRIQGGPGDTDSADGVATGTSSEDSIEATAGSEVDQASAAGRGAGAADAEANGGGGEASGNGGGDRAYQRYDVHHVARWIEQILPFSLLLLVVFIRQHLQGFFVTIWIAAVMFKSNDILRKQTALKGERKISVLIGITVIFMIHVFGVYWWYRNDDILRPLFMLPPKDIPPFWHAIFIIMVNDTMVRQASMAVKCMLLMYYKNCRGRNYRRQEEIDSVEWNKTWELAKLPHRHRAITLKWVYKLKRDEVGNVVKHMAWLVQAGVDYDEVFAPVARMEPVRLLLDLAAWEGWRVHHMDIKSAFLNGDLKEEVVAGLELEAGCDTQEDGLCLERMSTPCTGVSSLAAVATFKAEMKGEFLMRDQGLLSFYFGIEVRQVDGTITLRQAHYSKQFLELAGMAECNPAETPMEE